MCCPRWISHKETQRRRGNADGAQPGAVQGGAALTGGLRVFVPLSRLHGEGMIQVVTDFEYQGKRCVYTAGDFRMILNTFIDLTNSLISKSMLV